MFTDFRTEMLTALADLPADQLQKVARALDTVSAHYEIKQAATGEARGREEFRRIANAYQLTRKTEGLARGTLYNSGRILDTFILAQIKPINELKAADVREYLYNYKDAHGVSNRSLEGIRSRLCTFFKWAASEGYISADPTANVRPIKYTARPRKALTQLELERVRRACKDDRERAIVETLYSTGCRVSELCGIQRADVDFDRREVQVLGKGGKYRTVYLNAKALISIQAYLTARAHPDDPFLFCNDQHGGGQMQRGSVEEFFRRIKADTGIQVSPHILRHTMATQALTGTRVEVVQKLLGHSSINTTMIYAEVNADAIHAEHERSVI